MERKSALCHVVNPGPCRPRVRHVGESPEHVGDDVDDGAAVLFEVLVVDCYGKRKKITFQPAQNLDYVSPSLDIRKVPVRFVSMTAFHPFNFMSPPRDGNCPPPLFTRKSSFPNFDSTSDTAALEWEKMLELKLEQNEANGNQLT